MQIEQDEPEVIEVKRMSRRQIELAAEQIVLVVNASGKQIRFKFNGVAYVFPPKTGRRVTADKAWLWFGQPHLRSSQMEWNRECRLVHHRVGDWVWELMMKGELYCLEFGKGKEYYNAVFHDGDNEAVTGIPLDQLDVESGTGGAVPLDEIDELVRGSKHSSNAASGKEKTK